MNFFNIGSSPSNLAQIINAIFGDDFSSAKPQRRVFKHGFVAVKCGDCIGIDAGSHIIVTNKRNNVGLLVKANYSEPFPAVAVECVGKAVHSVGQLQAGKTYAVFRDGGDGCVFKYVGNSRAYVFDGEDACLMGMRSRFPYDVYELQIVSHK